MDRTALAAILAATRDDAALYLDNGAYLDWSDSRGDTISLEVGNLDSDAVQIELTRAEAEQLVHRLAATLLAG
jgi:hypothetical protein